MTLKLSTVVFAGTLLLPFAATAQNVNDAQIAAIVVTANQVDMDAGKVAAAKGTNPQVKAFGKQMAADHAGVNKSAMALVQKLKVTPEDNPTSKTLAAGGKENVAHLEMLSGTAFDKAYIDHEVMYHEQVIEAMDKTLIPNASNADLRALLVKVRPAFVSHLEHAKQVQAMLAR
jgi:putative membrane protein